MKTSAPTDKTATIGNLLAISPLPRECWQAKSWFPSQSDQPPPGHFQSYEIQNAAHPGTNSLDEAQSQDCFHYASRKLALMVSDFLTIEHSMRNLLVINTLRNK